MRNSIRTRLTVAFIGLATVPLLLVGVILAWQGFTTEKRQALNLQREVARRVATEVTAFFEALENELRLVSKAQVWPGSGRNEQHSILKLLMSQDVLEELVLLDNQGQEQFHLSRLGLSPTDCSNHAEADEFVIPQTSGQVYYSPVRFDETTGEPLMTIAVPLLDVRTSMVDGVLISEVRLKKIWNLIAGIQVSPGQSVYIVDAQDKVVAHRNPSVVLRGTSFDVPEQDGIQPSLTGSSGVLAVNTVRFGEQEFNIVAEQAVPEALALAINSMYVIVATIMVALVVASSLGFLIVRQIVQPIESLTATAQAISGGDLSLQVEVTSRDEIGQLATAFNSMLAQLRELFDSLEQRIAERKRVQEALRESEKKYRTLVEQSLQGLVVVQGSDIVFTNAALAEIIGYTVEELLSFSSEGARAIIHPEDQAFVWGRLQDRLAGKAVPSRYECRGIRKDGTVRWLEMFSTRIEYHGKPAVQGAIIDITERKRAEEALRESEEKFRTFTESAPVAIIIYQNYQCVYTNPAAETITGYTNEELLSMKFWDVTHPDYKDVIEERGKAIDRGESVPKQYELRIVAKDGSEKWIDGRLELIEYEGKRAALISAIDITERKWAEEERTLLLTHIREQAQQMHQIIDTVPEGVLLLDAEKRVMLANPTAKEDLAVLADAKVGDVLTHLGDRPLAELLTSPPKGLWHEVKSDSRTFEAIARPIKVGPTPSRTHPEWLEEVEPVEGWVLVIRDVTHEREIQQRAQQQERLAAIGQLAAGIAHDFNNIMAVIVLYTQMGLRTPNLPPETHRRLETVTQQAKRATDLIQQILDFSRRAVLERCPMDLVPFLKEQLRLLKRTLPEHITIDLHYGPDEYTVNADPTRMQQVLMNLAVNARDAMPKGGDLRFGLARIRVQAHEEAPLPEMSPGDWVQMTVADTGTGIPAEALPHIFEPFFTTKAPLGSGLGLAQVHGIVKQHEGEVDVTTKLGKGTTFTIYLPSLPVAEPRTPPEEASTFPKGQGETILVVEDDAVTRQALSECLTLLNYQVLAAANGREALAILEQHAEIAAVLSDVVMPEMGGMALLEALHQRGLEVPVLLLTGHPMERDVEKLQAQGLSTWLLKPPSLEQLAQAMSETLMK